MRRVSTNMANDDMQYQLRRQEEALANMQSRVGSQTKILSLRDDPLAASHAVRYESYLARLERYEENTLYAQDHYRQTDIYLSQGVEIMQRVRELAVQGAHGIYTKDDLRNMGVEVNELLNELVSLSNAVGPDGTRLFSGDKAVTEPFDTEEGTVPGGGASMIVAVTYRGAGSARNAEIGEGIYTGLDIGGGEAFWAEKMEIFSSVDASSWQAAEAGAFTVDGVTIPVKAGDTLPLLVDKINASAAPVRAAVDPDTGGLNLTGTTAHLIRLEDQGTSHTLQDLGVIQAGNGTTAPNWDTSARVSGGSVFDKVIELRDALFRGDTAYIGGQGLGGVDLALGNMETRLADIGSRAERAEMAWSRINTEIPNAASYLSREADLDLTAAATELAAMDYAHKATLQVTAKLVPQTLLDFLK